jgi:hypothetical protein
MIAVCVMGPMKVAVVGAPSYFAQRNRPRTPDEFARHSCVQYRRHTDGCVFGMPLPANPVRDANVPLLLTTSANGT